MVFKSGVEQFLLGTIPFNCFFFLRTLCVVDHVLSLPIMTTINDHRISNVNKSVQYKHPNVQVQDSKTLFYGKKSCLKTRIFHCSTPDDRISSPKIETEVPKQPKAPTKIPSKYEAMKLAIKKLMCSNST